MHDDEDETNHLCGQHQGKNLLRTGVTQLLMMVPPRLPSAAPVRKRKGPPVWQDPTAFLGQDVSRDSCKRAEDTSILGKKAEDEAPRNIISKLSEERSLRDLHVQHYHMAIAQFKKRTTHLDIPGNFNDLYPHVVKKCPFCNSVKPRPERSRVSGLRPEEFGDLIFLDHGSVKMGDKNLRISDCVGWSHIKFDSLSMQKYLSIGSYC